MLSSIHEWIIQDVVYSYPAADDPGFLKYTRKYSVLSLHHHSTHTHTLTTTLSPPAILAGWIYDIISLKY